MEKNIISNLLERYNILGLPEPRHYAYIETNTAIIILRWWGSKPIVSIQRTDNEKKRLTTVNKFGDVIPVSSLVKFQKAVLNVVPELKHYAKAVNFYDLQFCTLDNKTTFYLLLDKLDKNKEFLSETIRKS